MSLWVLCQILFYGIIAINTAAVIVNNAQDCSSLSGTHFGPCAAAENRFLSRCGDCAVLLGAKRLKTCFFLLLNRLFPRQKNYDWECVIQVWIRLTRFSLPSRTTASSVW